MLLCCLTACLFGLLDFDTPPPAQEETEDTAAFNVIADHRAGGKLPSWKVPIRICDDAACRTSNEMSGYFVGESWSDPKTRVIDRGKGIAVTGSSRMFYGRNKHSGSTGPKQWMDVEYEHLHLIGKSLSFTIDLSGVRCGCNAAVYLVQMGVPAEGSAGYCDIQGFDTDEFEACTEVDVVEGNQKALQATLHTAQGKGENGICNQDGCAGNWGRYDEETAENYGLANTKGVAAHTIDSAEPMHVKASVRAPRAVHSSQRMPRAAHHRHHRRTACARSYARSAGHLRAPADQLVHRRRRELRGRDSAGPPEGGEDGQAARRRHSWERQGRRERQGPRIAAL